MPHHFKDGAGERGPCSMERLFCTDAHTRCPRRKDIAPRARIWLLLSGATQSDSSLFSPGRCRAETQSSGGPCSFGSNCCILLPPLCHSAWFGTRNFFLDHPLRLAGLSSPGAPHNLFRPSLRRSSSLCHSQAAPASRQLHTQQAPVSAQCRFCSMSTSCSSHVASVLPNGRPMLVGAAGTTGKWGTRLGWRGQGSQPLTLLSGLEMCLLHTAGSCHPSLPVCQLSASLSIQHLHFSSQATLPGTGDRPRLPLWSCLLAVHIPPSLDIFLGAHEAPAHVA